MSKKIDLPEVYKANKDLVFDILSAIGIKSFVVVFDGGGDSGQVEEAGDFKPANKAKKVEKLLAEPVNGARISEGTRWSSAGHEEIWKDNPTLEEMISSVCYEALESSHGGWEINEGSYGEFLFDVENRKVELDFNQRITDTQNYRHTL